MKALSIKQPWAWAILNAGKDIENRDWKTNFYGTVAVHASKGMTKEDYQSFVICASDLMVNTDSEISLIPDFSELIRGAILGTVEIVDCVSESRSPWFFGDYGFVLRNPIVLPEPIFINGALGFWEVPKDAEEKIIQFSNTDLAKN